MSNNSLGADCRKILVYCEGCFQSLKRAVNCKLNHLKRDIQKIPLYSSRVKLSGVGDCYTKATVHQSLWIWRNGWEVSTGLEHNPTFNALTAEGILAYSASPSWFLPLRNFLLNAHPTIHVSNLFRDHYNCSEFDKARQQLRDYTDPKEIIPRQGIWSLSSHSSHRKPWKE